MLSLLFAVAHAATFTPDPTTTTIGGVVTTYVSEWELEWFKPIGKFTGTLSEMNALVTANSGPMSADVDWALGTVTHVSGSTYARKLVAIVHDGDAGDSATGKAGLHYPPAAPFTTGPVVNVRVEVD